MLDFGGHFFVFIWKVDRAVVFAGFPGIEFIGEAGAARAETGGDGVVFGFEETTMFFVGWMVGFFECIEGSGAVEAAVFVCVVVIVIISVIIIVVATQRGFGGAVVRFAVWPDEFEWF